MQRILAALLIFAPLSALADPVMVRMGMDVKAPIAELMSFLDKADALSGKINPDSDTTTALYFNNLHGDNSGGVSLVITYANEEAWAADNTRLNASEEWQTLMAAYPQARFPIHTQVMSESVYRSPGYAAAKPGELMQIFAFDWGDVGISVLVEFIEKVAALRKKMRIPAHVDILVPVASGSLTNTAAITVRFANPTAWAEARRKQGESKAWGELFATFPADEFRLRYQAISIVAR